jgi:predicted amidohydrolase
MKPFTIAGISFWPKLWKPASNVKLLLKYLEQAAGSGAQVVATPEGAVDGYITKDLAKHRLRPDQRHTKGYGRRLIQFKKRQLALADEIKKECLPAIREKVAQLGVYLFVNTLDRRKGDAVYNTTFVIDPRGKITGKYDKIHAAFEVVNTLGKGHYVFPTPYAPIGVVVCADRQYPEAPRSVALAGARLLIINSYGMFGQGENERFIRQRAYENGLFLLFSHPAESVLVSPEGRIIAATCEWEHVVTRTIDPEQAVGRGVFGTRAMAKTYLTGDVKAYARRRAEKRKKPPK